MDYPEINLLLADDDKDDCLLFEEILDEIPLDAKLTTISNGAELMFKLNEVGYELPDIVFLDLNMPRKTGFECLSEIKKNEKLKHLPVIIISTSYQKDVIDLLFDAGAHHYIHKSNNFLLLREAIFNSIIRTMKSNFSRPGKAEFELKAEPL